MAVAQKNEKLILQSILILAIIHIVVSLCLIFIDYGASKAPGRPVLLWTSAAWGVSLIVCLIIVALTAAELRYNKQREQTPCPLQLSYPNESSQDRQDIRKFIDIVNNITGPGQYIPQLVYDSQRTYIIITGYYLRNLNITEASTSTNRDHPTLPPALRDFLMAISKSKLSVIPIGYVEGSKIFALRGLEVWPDLPNLGKR